MKIQIEKERQNESMNTRKFSRSMSMRKAAAEDPMLPLNLKLKLLKDIEAPHCKKDAMTWFMEAQEPSKKFSPQYILSEWAKLQALKLQKMMQESQQRQSGMKTQRVWELSPIMEPKTKTSSLL